MLILASTTDKLQVVCGSAGTVNVHASFLDNVSGAVNPGRKNTTIINTALTDVVSPPASNVQRTLKTLHVHNHGASSNAVTVIITDGTTACTLHSINLPPNATLQYIDELGFGVSNLSNRIPITNISSAYTVSVLDNNGVINANGSFTLSLLSVAAAGAGFMVRIRNTGMATVLIDPSGSELVNGFTTLRCCAKEEFSLVCDGTGWVTTGRATAVRLERVKVTSAVPAVAMTIPPDYDMVDVIFDRITQTAVNAVVMYLQSALGNYYGPAQYMNLRTVAWEAVQYPVTVAGERNYPYAILSGGTATPATGDSDICGSVRIFPNTVPVFRGPSWIGMLRYLYQPDGGQVIVNFAGEIIPGIGGRATGVQFNTSNLTSGLFHLMGHVPGEPP